MGKANIQLQDAEQLTEARRALLEYLAERRFATTTQLNQETQSGKIRTTTLHDLDWLRQAGMVRSFPTNPALGRRSELGWLLTSTGAATLKFENFGTNYYRQPSQQKLKLREMELDLTRSVSFASDTCPLENVVWSLIEPLTFSPARPLPDKTPQYHKLREAIDFKVANQTKQAVEHGQLTITGQTVSQFKEATQRLNIPRQLNDYVVYLDLSATPDPRLQAQITNVVSWAGTLSQHYVNQPIKGIIAFVMILCPPSAGEKFWLSRLNRYSRLAKYLPVYGIFDKVSYQQSGERLLNSLVRKEKKRWQLSGYGVNLKTLTLAGVYELLESVSNQLAAQGVSPYLAAPGNSDEV